MASIFLSYSREDAAKADRIAHALEAAGHQVWWDRRIGAGSRFSKEIDAALKSADLVVVLWSKASVDSAWVQDEAADGRDTGRLVPVLIDPVSPPLGFRQYQSIDLARRRGSNAAGPLLEAIAAKAGQPPAAATPRPSWSWNAFGWRIPALIAVISILLVAVYLVLSRPGGDDHTIAIAAQGGDMPKSRDLARSVALDLGRYTTGPLGSLTIVQEGDEGASDAEYRVEVGVSGDGTQGFVDLALSATGDPEKLWTTSLKGDAGKLVDMRQQAVASLGNVLSCLSEIRSQRTKIRRDVLGLYLNGCGKFSDINSSTPGEEILNLFRQITDRAPDFAPGWAYLALVEIQSWPSVRPEDHHELVMSARAHLKRARQLNPDSAVAFAADAFLPEHAGGPALAILDEGLKRHPDNAMLRESRSYYLAFVGRTNEAIADAFKAIELNPLSPTLRDAYASALAYAGRTDAAFNELRKAEALWPGSTVLRQARYRLDLRYGDPRNALRLLRESGAGELTDSAAGPVWHSFLEARIDPTPANIESALDAFRERSRKVVGDWGYLQALGTFNRVDEAYRLMETDEAIEGFSATPDAFFRIHMRSIYSDPRFMRVAQRLGLLEYWQSSGRWPDFCREPKLPYDCKEVAAQLGSAKAS